MNETHDHPVKLVPATELNNTHVLVGESGGLSAVYEIEKTSVIELAIITEHGTLFAYEGDEFSVLDYPEEE